MVSSHPVLSVTPVGSLVAPRFIRLPFLNLDEVVQITTNSSEDLDQILENHHNRPFKQGDADLVPFWRLHVIKDALDLGQFDIIFCFHHCLADTQSALVFMQDMEAALTNPASKNRGPETGSVPRWVIETAPIDRFPPPVEAVIDLPLSRSFKNAQISPVPESVWSGRPQCTPVQTRFRSTCLSAAFSLALVDLCKNNNATITSVLMAVLSRALFSMLPGQYTEVNIDCAVSLRRFLGSSVGERDMGCWVGGLRQNYTRSDSKPLGFIWQDVGRARFSISEMLGKQGGDTLAGYLRDEVPDMAVWLRQHIGKKRASACEISNVGAIHPLPVKTDDGCRITRLLFSQSASACSGAMKVSVISGRDQRLSIGYSWQSGIIEEQLANDVIEATTRLLETLILEETASA